MRLYNAICGWLEAHAASMSQHEEFYPEGAGEARSEHAHSYAIPPELHQTSHHWSPGDEECGRRAGFQRNSTC